MCSMNIGSFIVFCISFFIATFVYIKVFPLCLTVEKFCNIILTPVDFLCNLFSSRKSSLGNNMIIRLIVTFGVFAASVGYIVISFISGVDYVDLIKSLLGGNSLLGFMDLILLLFGPKDSYIYAAVVSIGISSFLSFLYMRCTVETFEETNLPKAVKFFLLILFNLLFSLISFFMSESIVLWCDNIGKYMISIYHDLAVLFTFRRLPLLYILKMIPIGLLLLVFLYITFNAFVITFREMLATIMYGIFALGLLLIVNVPILMFPDFPPAITSFLSTICLLIPDYIRANENAKDSFIQFIKRLGKSRH